MVKKNKQIKRTARHKRVRAKVFGTAKRPRFSIFKSNKYFYIQLIDDSIGKTLVSVSGKKLSASDRKTKEKTDKIVAYELGKSLAKKAISLGVKTIVFDRGGYKFHGAILQIAAGAREEGLKF